MPTEKTIEQDLAEQLIACPSVTPRDKGAMKVLTDFLEPLGFKCQIFEFGEGIHKTKNLYARYGDKQPNLAFAGHVDVVPVGHEEHWRFPPFSPTVADGFLFGRGAVDMKGGVASWCAAIMKLLNKIKNEKKELNGSLSLLITGDEEGHAMYGTKMLLDAIAEQGEKLSACITGEPTCPHKLGEMIKIGRRGSLVARMTVRGKMGHTGYPDLADNPIPQTLDMLNELRNWKLDEGNDKFEKSHLIITSVDVGNHAGNIIPDKVNANFNIRFNNFHNSQKLIDEVEAMFKKFTKNPWHIEWEANAESFLTEEGEVSQKLSKAIKKVTGMDVKLKTIGGTSDSRFIKDFCPVMDFGHVYETIHQVDEKVALKDLTDLTEIYYEFMADYFPA